MKVVILGGCGYIGSTLHRYLLEQGFEVDTVDLEWFGNFSNPKNFLVDYNSLSKSFFKKYSAIILLAGHSSVQMSQSDQDSVFKNNVRNFVNLLQKVKDQKFVYASSSSLYAGLSGEAIETECSYQVSNYYDLSKKEIDLYAELSNRNYYGLRFATVNGPSINFRSDLMINKMYVSAKTTGIISVFNEDIRRPILGLNDLCRAVDSILQGVDNPGIYNLSSFNAKVGEIAQTVALLAGSAVENKGNSPTYDFHISNDKFCKNYNFAFQDSITSIVQDIDDKFSSCNLTLRDMPITYEG